MHALSNTLKQHVINSLIYHRKWWRVSQRSLGTCLGWGYNTVNKIEKGNADLTLTQLCQLACFFNETLPEFVNPKWSEKLKEWRRLHR